MSTMNLFRAGLRTSVLVRPMFRQSSSFMARTPSSVLLRPSVVVNDRATVRLESTASHNHSKQWNMEHLTTIALLGTIPAALVLENPVVDSVLAVLLSAHVFWGLECIITDYVHGPTLPKVAMGSLYAVMALTLTGLLYFNYKDIGISKAVKKVWSL